MVAWDVIVYNGSCDILTSGAGSNCVFVSLLEVSLVGESPYLVLYADMRL